MRKSKWMASGLTAVMLLTLLGGLVASGPAEAAGLRLRAKLTGPAIGGEVPHGVAKYREARVPRKFSTEVQDVNLPAGSILHVLVNGTEVGIITLDALMRGQLELRRSDGDVVPLVKAGDVVSVVDGGGITILSGTF